MEQNLHYEELAALGDLLAAECRFQLWTYDELKVKNSITEEGIDVILERGEILPAIEDAILKFSTDRQSDELIHCFVEAAGILNDRSLPEGSRDVTAEK